jgi:enoyl-CoA hydratase/carnithine racemase
MMAEYTNVKVSIEDRVAVLTLDHPPVNAFSNAMLQDLEAAFDEMVADDQVKVIVITGGGQVAFAAGADIKEMASFGEQGGAETGLVFMKQGQDIFNKIECSPKPVIAAINGVALGGGMELAMACHIRILADRARIGQSESNLGIIPGWGGTQRLPRIVGASKAIELILTGDMINAQEAFRLGLANKVVPAGQVMHEVLGLAKKIAAKSKITNQATLDTVINGMRMSLEEGLLYERKRIGEVMNSNDTREGLTAFVEKRQAKFTDS